MNSREIIARRVARFFNDGELVNLGIGLPTTVADYLPRDCNILFHSENGFIGVGPSPAAGQEDKDLVNAGAQPATIIAGGAFFDSAVSFALIRGGHVTTTVLGALEVDEEGNLANWMVPGKIVPGMGGAMDLVAGAKKVIVAMEHNTRDGGLKIRKKCTLPLTGAGVVDIIVTELGVMEVTPQGLVLKELAPGVSVEEIQKRTEAQLILSENLTVMVFN